MTGVTSVAGTGYLSGAYESFPSFLWSSWCSVYIFVCIIL